MGPAEAVGLRAVLDTNVLVSALRFAGVCAELPALWQRQRFTPVVSSEILEEYARVLAYTKFHLAEAEIQIFIEEDFLPYAEVVRGGHAARVVLADPSDDKFLSCAIAGRVSYIVSGDAHLLALGRHRDIPILPPGQFLKVLGAYPVCPPG